MSDSFPLTRALGLSVVGAANANHGVSAGIRYVEADALEALLAKAPVVYGYGKSDHIWQAQKYDQADHTALLVNVQPIVRDSFEQLAKDICHLLEKEGAAVWPRDPYHERLKKLLGEEPTNGG